MEKRILYKTDSLALYNMENYCHEVARQIRAHAIKEGRYVSIDRSFNMIYPLWHYIFSARASTEFMRALLSTKPFMIARRICAGGSDDEIMERIKKLVLNRYDHVNLNS